MSRKSRRMIPERPAAPVLVVEDNAEVRQALVALLEAEGYHVAEAVDGVSALRLLRTGGVQPCLIVLDLMMADERLGFPDGAEQRPSARGHPRRSRLRRPSGVSGRAHGGGSRPLQARRPRAIPRADRAPLHAVAGRAPSIRTVAGLATHRKRASSLSASP